tara:strand:+ start:123 stop:803 length:681 start_codon:yes stop_codon:yes gene_type:complete
MIIHQLIRLHLNYEKNAHAFFELQANDAIEWLEYGGVDFDKGRTMLDLGCGYGYFGRACAAQGMEVTYSDLEDLREESLKEKSFRQVDLNTTDLASLGQYDLVTCSNVLEHLENPNHLLQHLDQLLKPGGVFYLSWTNWLSPWGGHEFSPWHYLGKRSGPIHTVGQNLFKTYIGTVLKTLRGHDALTVRRLAPRYYNEFAFLMHLPGVREFLAWNCAVQVEKVVLE